MAGLWTLHTSEGRNIQLHFLDFSIETANDVVEVRDGTGSESTLLGEDAIQPNCPFIGPLHWKRTSNIVTLICIFFSAVLTGDKGPTHDLYSTTNQMSVWFITNKSVYSRGFRANFTSGVGLGMPGRGCVKRKHEGPPISDSYSVKPNILYIQLLARTISFSVTQEVALTVKTSAMVWLIVPMPLMKQTVVSWPYETEME